MPIIVKKKPIIKLEAGVATVAEQAIGGTVAGWPGEEYEREERMAIMTIDGGLSEEEAARYIDHPELIVEASNSGKIKPWNPESEIPYLEFYFNGELVGASHVSPEIDEEVTARFFARYEKPYAVIRERMTEERKRSLFKGRGRAW